MLLHENLMIFYCLLDGEHTKDPGLCFYVFRLCMQVQAKRCYNICAC